MTIDTAPSRFPGIRGAETVDVRTEDSRIVAVFDGTGSWGDGEEEARVAARRLEIEWSWDFPRATQVARDADAGDYAFGAVLVVRGECSVVLRLSYGALHVRAGTANVIHQPPTWVDAQVKDGNLTVAEAAVHPLRGVLLSNDWFNGPPIHEGIVIVADIEVTRHLLLLPVETWSHRTAAEMQALAAEKFARPVVVVRL